MRDRANVAAESDAAQLEFERIQGELDAGRMFAAALHGDIRSPSRQTLVSG